MLQEMNNVAFSKQSISLGLQDASRETDVVEFEYVFYDDN